MATKKLAPLGLVLRGLRAAAGITQKAHAEVLGISPGSLSKIETGQKKASYEQLHELIGALDVSPQAETQARLAILHGDGILSESELTVLFAHHGCWPVICLYKSHATFGKLLGLCGDCDARITCRPEGHGCPNRCGPGGTGRPESNPDATVAHAPAGRRLNDPTEALPCPR